MPFTAGLLCCAQDACVMLDTTAASDSASWDTIPHVTQIQFTQTANTSKLVTSSTNGQETSVCGTVSNTGTLSIACHDGDGPVFCINENYHIMWSIDCANLLETPVDPYYRALIKITSVPVDFNISNSAAVIYAYNFDVVEWYHQPQCQTAEL
jgi:hypothetical protein